MDYLNRINNLCIKHGVRRSDVCRATGITDSTLRGWNKYIPTVENVYKVSQYFHISVEEFITGVKGKIVLSPEEENLINFFRACDDRDKAELMQIAELKSARN